MKVVFIYENDLSEQTCKNRKLFATEIIFSNNPKCTLLTDLLRYTITAEFEAQCIILYLTT